MILPIHLQNVLFVNFQHANGEVVKCSADEKLRYLFFSTFAAQAYLFLSKKQLINVSVPLIPFSFAMNNHLRLGLIFSKTIMVQAVD